MREWHRGMFRFGFGALALGAGSLGAQINTFTVAPVGEAPPFRSQGGPWAQGIKDFFGTAYEQYDNLNQYSAQSPTAPLSKVWFTGSKGILNEVYWPTLDRPQIRDSQILVTDGNTFLFEERKHSRARVEWLANGVPAYRVETADPEGRFVITKTFFTDPQRDAVVMQVRIQRNVEGLRFFWLHNPSAGNSPLGDSGEVAAGAVGDAFLKAWQNDEYQALYFGVPVRQASVGFEEQSDGFQDLSSDFAMDSHFQYARNGNIALMAWLEIPEIVGVSEFPVVLSFARRAEDLRAVATPALQNPQALRDTYVSQWQSYQSTVTDLSAAANDRGQLFRASVALLKSMEDKTFEGAFVASPSIPWGQHYKDKSLGAQEPSNVTIPAVAGYHLVWTRDLYQMATTFLAIDDPRSAKASLQYMRRIQFGPDDGRWNYGPRNYPKNGSFPQNSWVNGTQYWMGLQMDQTSFPIILAYRLWQDGHIVLADYWDMVKRAGDFIQRHGPWTAQERWEESFGASPSTIAAEISALWLASAIAREMNDNERADRYKSTAHAWSAQPHDNIESWTFTSNGSFGNGKYYTRLEGAATFNQTWDPNDNIFFTLSNNGGTHLEKNIMDGGFLELVRLGVRAGTDFFINETLHEYDDALKTQTPLGAGYKRYLNDRYNYVNDTNEQTGGMLWPLLTGERGMAELQKAIELREENPNVRQDFVDSKISPYLQTIENFATPSLMIPEQVWDAGPFVGQPTGAATPLGWSHGEYVKILRARRDQRNPDLVPKVVEMSREAALFYFRDAP